MVRFLVYFLAFGLLGFSGWIGRTFGDPSIDQIVYHLRYAEGAAIEMGQIFLLTFLAEVVVFPLLFALAAAALHTALERWRPHWARHVLRAPPVAAWATGLGALLLQFSVFSYAAAYFGPDLFSLAYRDPRTVRIDRPAAGRNLVLIYVESLESTYGDSAVFGRDLLAPLRGTGWSFSRYRPAPGATWTIAGMVATQCGVPLRIYSEYDIRHKEGAKAFLPGAACLGDLLQERGYRNVFLEGAPLSFSGKGTFLRDHGYAETWGRDEWEREGVKRGDLNEWGLYDGPLFERALARLAALHRSKAPFNLTLLTIDTHNPNGFLGPDCRGRGAKDFSGIVSCDAAQIAEFIATARQQGLLENTVVVVVGDHLAVPNPLYAQLQSAPERGIFNLVLTDEPAKKDRDEIEPFDLYPTLLELLGFRVDGGRLGLGYAAVHHPGLAPPADRAVPVAGLAGSAAYSALWRSPAD